MQQASATELSVTPSRFRCKQQMAEAAGCEGLVCLHFSNSPDKAILYAHKSFLRCCSGVLRSLLAEDTTLAFSCTHQPDQQQASKAAKLTEGSSPSATAATQAPAATDPALPVIPLTDEEPAAWEDTLGLVYPLTPATKVGWDNAKRLLLLADKYDAPCITDWFATLSHILLCHPSPHNLLPPTWHILASERVRSFFTAENGGYFDKRTVLSGGLQAGNVFDWLLVFSKCNLDDLAAGCINYITASSYKPTNSVLPEGFFSSGLQPKHVEQLCRALQKQNQGLRQQLTTMEAQVEAGPKRHCMLGSLVYHCCSNCGTQWYRQPHSSNPAPHCIKCGIAKQRGLLS